MQRSSDVIVWQKMRNVDVPPQPQQDQKKYKSSSEVTIVIKIPKLRVAHFRSLFWIVTVLAGLYAVWVGVVYVSTDVQSERVRYFSSSLSSC